MRERQKKPSADMEMTEAKWRDFLNHWARYKRSSGISGQDIVDDLILCLSDELRLEVTSELGDGMENITEAVITKAEAEEQAKMAQDKLTKGIKQEAIAEVSVVEIYKAKLGNPKKNVNFATGQDMGKILMSKQGRNYARLSDRLATDVRVLDILPMYVQAKRRTPRTTPWPQYRTRISLQSCSALSR